MGRHWKYEEFLEKQREGERKEERGEWIISYDFNRFPPSSLYKQINRAIGKGLRLKRLQQALFLAEGEASKEFLITLLDDEGASKVEVMEREKGGERKKESPRIPESELMDELISKVLSDPILTKALGKSRDAKGMSRLIEMIGGTF